MLDGLNETRSPDTIVAADAVPSNRCRFGPPAGLIERCAELGIEAPTAAQMAMIRMKARASDRSEDDELEAWIKGARRRAANRVAKHARIARKARLTVRSERMAKALAVRGTTPRKRWSAVAQPEEAEPRRERCHDGSMTAGQRRLVSF